jgi:hypothetical protein
VTRRALLLAAVVALSACRETEQTVIVREIVMHVPQSCKIEQDPGADPYAIYFAYGDFAFEAGDGVRLTDVGKALPSVPGDTRAIAANVLVSDDKYWTAYSEIPQTGPIDLLLWRSGSVCTLSVDLGRRVEPAFGAIDGQHVLVAGGKPPPGASIPYSFVADLRTGITTRLATGLLTPRAGATVTPFGSGALVAGGRAIDTDAPLAPGSAEVYVPGAGGAAGDFDGKPIPLSRPRADHAAVVLATGETLLVGGVGADGKPLATLEIVDPVKRQSLTRGLAQLQVPRIKPSVVRLASGEILVGGGKTLAKQPDGSEALVNADRLEFFARDALSVARKPEPYRPGRETRLIALPAGGALMVNAGEITDTITTVYVVNAEGRIEVTPRTVAGEVTQIRLFDGGDGSPVLWTGDRWLRWRPWLGELEPLTEAIRARPGPEGDAIASPDSGLAMWLADGGARIAGMRFTTRQSILGPYAYVRPLLVDGVDGLAPDRFINLRRNDEQPLRYGKQFGLTLDAGATAFVTDATFASFTLEAEIPTGLPPLFVLRDAGGLELEIGGPACPMDVELGVPTRVRIERDGEVVRAAVLDRAARECERRVPGGARLSVGVRGAVGPGRSAVRNLVLTRR